MLVSVACLARVCCLSCLCVLPAVGKLFCLMHKRAVRSLRVRCQILLLCNGVDSRGDDLHAIAMVCVALACNGLVCVGLDMLTRITPYQQAA